jgi:hypothetical protein
MFYNVDARRTSKSVKAKTVPKTILKLKREKSRKAEKEKENVSRTFREEIDPRTFQTSLARRVPLPGTSDIKHFAV